MNTATDPNTEPGSDESKGRALGPRREAHALSVGQMESRKLIHRDPSARESADAFREIRTQLLALAGEQNFVTMVAAVSPRSGGSFVARNLATAFAFGDAMTALLIDCNLRHPSQARAFDIDDERGGLVEYLGDPARSVDEVVYRTGVARLQLIPAGIGHEMSNEYFSSLRMRTMIDSLRSRYLDRYLVLDAPAVKGSPDARILSDLADLVVVVAGYGHDTPARIAEASSVFDPKKLAGVVFNHAP